MSLVTLPRAGMPLVNASPMSREWYRWAHDITQRVGGVTGQSNDELTMSQFEDAGVEEIKFSVYRLADEAAILPPAVAQQIEDLTTEINQLRDCVATLMQAMQDMQQGTTL